MCINDRVDSITQIEISSRGAQRDSVAAKIYFLAFGQGEKQGEANFKLIWFFL